MSETPVLEEREGGREGQGEGERERDRDGERERGARVERVRDRLNKKGTLENGSVLKLGQIQESKAFVSKQVFAMCPWPSKNYNYSPKPPNHIQCAI